MGDYLNIRRLVTQEFKKEFRKRYGHPPLENIIRAFKKLIDLKAVQEKVDQALDEKQNDKERSAVRKYHRDNLRYLAQYFAETFANQLRSSGVALPQVIQDEELLQATYKTFKSNPQCKVYH